MCIRSARYHCMCELRKCFNLIYISAEVPRKLSRSCERARTPHKFTIRMYDGLSWMRGGAGGELRSVCNCALAYVTNLCTWKKNERTLAHKLRQRRRFSQDCSKFSIW